MYGIAHRLCVLFHTFVALFCIFKSMKERKKVWQDLALMQASKFIVLDDLQVQKLRNLDMVVSLDICGISTAKLTASIIVR